MHVTTLVTTLVKLNLTRLSNLVQVWRRRLQVSERCGVDWGVWPVQKASHEVPLSDHLVKVGSSSKFPTKSGLGQEVQMNDRCVFDIHSIMVVHDPKVRLARERAELHFCAPEERGCFKIQLQSRTLVSQRLSGSLGPRLSGLDNKDMGKGHSRWDEKLPGAAPADRTSQAPVPHRNAKG